MADNEENIKFNIEDIKENTSYTIDEIENILYDENKKKHDLNKRTIYTGYFFLGAGIILGIGNKHTNSMTVSKAYNICKRGSNILSVPLVTSGILLTSYGLLNNETYKL